MLLTMIVVVGCGGSAALRRGQDAIQEERYDAAVTNFERALAEDSTDAMALRGLGRAEYALKQYEEAEQHLAQAQRLRPKDPTTAFFLGLSREQLGNLSGAEGAYEAYLATKPKKDQATAVRGRLLYLRNQLVREQAKEAIRLEKDLVHDTTGPRTVAVLPFTLTGHMADSLEPLGKGLAAAVSYDLFQIKSIRVVERLRLNDILDELNLVKQGVVAKESAPRVGRLVGADYLVNSNLQFIDSNDVSVQSGIITPHNDAYRPALLSEEAYHRIWKIQKDITFAIIDSLGIVLTPKERNALKKIPTEKFPAFLAYSRGIEQLDQGNYEEANALFSEAAKIDPGFTQAAAMEQQSGLLMSGSQPIGQFENTAAPGLGAGSQVDIGPTTEFFDVTQPEADPRTDDPPSVETGSTSVSGTIP